MRGIIIGAVVACVALIGLAVFFTVNSSGGGPRIVALHSTYEQRVADGYWKKGATDPKVTLLEYLDFQCSACGGAEPLVQDVMSEMGTEVQLQVKQYPIVSSHPNAMAAARASEAAGRQGKFWEMHDILFAKQSEWTNLAPATFTGTLEQYAQSLALNMEQFRRDMRDRSLDDPIIRDQTAANRIPITGTPAFFVNGEMLPRTPANSENFKALLRSKFPST